MTTRKAMMISLTWKAPTFWRSMMGVRSIACATADMQVPPTVGNADGAIHEFVVVPLASARAKAKDAARMAVCSWCDIAHGPPWAREWAHAYTPAQLFVCRAAYNDGHRRCFTSPRERGELHWQCYAWSAT